MKVLYLFNRTKQKSEKDVRGGVEADNHFFGMLRLPRYGISAGVEELEQSIFAPIAPFLRKRVLNIHFAHLPLFYHMFFYDVVFTSTAFGLLLVKALLGIKRPKWVMFDFNIEELMGAQKTFKEKLFHFLVSKSDGIITISRSAEITMKKKFPQKADQIEFIPLGTDFEFFRKGKTLEGDFILCPGRDPGRDYGTFFSAIKDLPVEVVITARSAHLKKWGPIPKNVRQCDFTPIELRDAYERAKIVVIPLLAATEKSNNAMGCSTLVEALAMGCATVATDTPTMRSYVTNDENGILVKSGDSEALRDAITGLLAQPEKRLLLGLNARAFAERECSADLFAKRLALYFNKLLSS